MPNVDPQTAVAIELLSALQQLRATVEAQLSPQNISALGRLFSPSDFAYSPEPEHSRVLREGVCRISDIVLSNVSGATAMFVHIFNMYRVPTISPYDSVLVIQVPAATSRGVPELGGITFDKGIALFASTSATTLTAHTQGAKFYASWQV
jgi:hypothetical protein